MAALQSISCLTCSLAVALCLTVSAEAKGGGGGHNAGAVHQAATATAKGKNPKDSGPYLHFKYDKVAVKSVSWAYRKRASKKPSVREINVPKRTDRASP